MASGTDLVVCFCRGTLILTERGEVAVEELAVGDRVRDAVGRAASRSCGSASAATSSPAANRLARPVIVRRGALADNVPRRDLYLTHGHALYLDGVLIPVENLVNHRSILWDESGAGRRVLPHRTRRPRCGVGRGRAGRELLRCRQPGAVPQHAAGLGGRRRQADLRAGAERRRRRRAGLGAAVRAGRRADRQPTRPTTPTCTSSSTASGSTRQSSTDGVYTLRARRAARRRAAAALAQRRAVAARHQPRTTTAGSASRSAGIESAAARRRDRASTTTRRCFAEGGCHPPEDGYCLDRRRTRPAGAPLRASGRARSP